MVSVLPIDCLLELVREGWAVLASSSGDVSSAAAVPPRMTMNSYTAVTADKVMQRRVRDKAAELGVEGQGDVFVGNWADDALLGGWTYNTVLANYLVGSIDGFSPYFQVRILPRLARHLAPGGRMYVIGLQPVPDGAGGGGDVFCRITKVCDACILLAGHMSNVA